ncbi:hypothetical protein [Actinoplanes sp. NBRC 103695]|uniref:hypothetical protein n=1 Tax=Actinoplanes sp. NBRC 103695 TaxID=3032202 RepID=UPI0024A5D094|nr:hypothetical protein [Actinoplanes sp. NBRC 103695]GLY97648.1 hypothetical protein Acsp02_49020 [Actinoplanes sp. NBRC 103695]
MSKSNRRHWFGGSNNGRTVTVIEPEIERTQRRKAKIAFFVAAIVTALLAGTVFSSYVHPILGGLLGLLAGVLLGGILAVLIIIWPVLRIIWHWLPEILLGCFLVYGWTWLMFATPVWLSLLILAVIIGAPSAIGPARRAVLSAFWCLTVRHRLRMCFAAFIAHNRQRTLPFILFAKPTPAGERVWIWLRPGLSLSDLEQEGQTQKLAVACWANESRVTAASRKYAALIRVDIVRRETLTADVLSPLPDHVPDDMPATALASPATPPVGLNFADVPGPRTKRATNTNTRARMPRNPEPSSEIDPSDYV